VSPIGLVDLVDWSSKSGQSVSQTQVHLDLTCLAHFHEKGWECKKCGEWLEGGYNNQGGLQSGRVTIREGEPGWNSFDLK